MGRGVASKNARVTLSAQLLSDHGVPVVTTAAELRSHVVRQALVEFELHAGNGWISSRTSVAP